MPTRTRSTAGRPKPSPKIGRYVETIRAQQVELDRLAGELRKSRSQAAAFKAELKRLADTRGRIDELTRALGEERSARVDAEHRARDLLIELGQAKHDLATGTGEGASESQRVKELETALVSLREDWQRVDRARRAAEFDGREHALEIERLQRAIARVVSDYQAAIDVLERASRPLRRELGIRQEQRNDQNTAIATAS